MKSNHGRNRTQGPTPEVFEGNHYTTGATKSYQALAKLSLAHQLSSAQQRAAALARQGGAVPCYAVRCCAVLCRAALLHQVCTYYIVEEQKKHSKLSSAQL